MKNWNKPEIEEINVTLTMGGTNEDANEETSASGTKYIYVGSK